MGKSHKLYQKGQTLLIVVLVMVVALTVGLSVVSRSITNVRTTTEEANSAQALAAAEAGIAQAIQNNANISSAVGSNASFTATIATLSGQTTVFLNGSVENIVPQDEGADLWLVHHNTDGTPGFTIPPGLWTGNIIDIFW